MHELLQTITNHTLKVVVSVYLTTAQLNNFIIMIFIQSQADTKMKMDSGLRAKSNLSGAMKATTKWMASIIQPHKT